MKTTPDQLRAILAKPKKKVGPNLKEIVRRKLESDPITIRDRNTMREKWGI
jgi:cytochrome c2